MITHTNYEEELMGESVAEVRAHWKGMFIFGAPDVMVVNVTSDSIWTRKATIPPGSASGSMDPRAIFLPGQMPEKLRLPDPVQPREMQQEKFLRDMELDPAEFYPPGVFAPEIGATTVPLAQLNEERKEERPAIDDPDCT